MTLSPGRIRSAIPSTAALPARPSPRRGPAVRYRGLDGLRGILLIVVLLYHGGLKHDIPGGIVAMDVFFVLSGLLITSLLLAEKERSQRIGLKAFWGRRARRLLPGVIPVLIVVPLVWRYYGDSVQLPQVRTDALATLGYVANWHSIWTGTSYFTALGPPSPLLHMWSLGVEEQFYLVWPLVIAAILSRWGRRAVLAVCGIGALLATLDAIRLTNAGASASRLYYGTDVRCQALLAGAGVAALLHDPRVKAKVTPYAGVAAAIGAAALLAALPLVDGENPNLYRGGGLALAACAAALCAGLMLRPKSRLARTLSFRPLVALGIVSYGAYLWHWPVDLFISQARTGQHGVPLWLLQTAITLTISAVSYVFIETPIRVGRLRLVRPRLALPAAFAAVALLIALPPVHPAPTLYAHLGNQRPTAASILGPAATPKPVPTVLYYGDSIGYEAQGSFRDAMLSSKRVRVVLKAFPARAICDYLPQMPADIARYKPTVAVFDFLGVAYTPCMRSGGQPLDGSAQSGKVASDTRRALQLFTAHRIKIFWASSPVAPRLPYYPANTAAIKSVVAATPGATWVDASASVAPGGTWVKELPCLPGEPCPASGMNVVRGPDEVHFCPTLYTYADSNPPGRCPQWASGAWRYGLAQAAPVLRYLGLAVPARVLYVKAVGHRIPRL